MAKILRGRGGWTPLQRPAQSLQIGRSALTTFPRKAVRARLRRGTIPGHRIGDTWIIFKPEIRAWLASTSNQHRAGDVAADVDVLADYPDVLSYRDLMRLFGVKYKGTIYIWLEQGHIPGSFVEGRWIVHKWQLRERLDATSNQVGRSDSPE